MHTKHHLEVFTFSLLLDSLSTAVIRSLISVVFPSASLSALSVFLSTFSAGVNRQDLEVQTVANTDAITEMISWCIDASTLFIESGNPSYMAKGIINHCRLYVCY